MSEENNSSAPGSTAGPPDDGDPSLALAQAYAGDDWRARLARKKDKDGDYVEPPQYLAILRNVVTILQQDPAWQGLIAFDEFSGRVMKLRAPPYPGAVGEWSDYDDASLVLWLSEHYAMEPKDAMILKAVQIVAERNSFHEVRRYLEGLSSKGEQQLSYWLQAYLGVQAKPGSEEERYVQAVARKWMIGAVARIMRPGTKMDNVLILEGPQGSLKSTAARTLACDWFTDSPIRIGDREGYMIIRGRWICELAELDALNKADSSTAKMFFSQSEDRYRSPWGKRPADVKRQCAFVGTVNHEQYLRDETGGRRYWPVKCGTVDIPGLREARDQLWAEALAAFRAGEPWWVLPEEVALFHEQQDRRYVGDAWQEKIAAWMTENYCTEVSISQMMGLALGMDAAKWTRADQMRVGTILTRLGWQRRRSVKEGPDGVRAWIYCRPVLPMSH